MHQQLTSVILVASIAFVVAMVSGCGQQQAIETETVKYEPRTTKMSVAVALVVSRSINMNQEFTGDLLSRRRTRIVAQVEGVVQTIPQVGAKFDVTIDGQRYNEQLGLIYGQRVKAGDLLTQLDPRDFEIEVRMAQAKLAKARADLAELNALERPEELRRLEAMKKEVVARHQQALRELKRLESVVQSGAITASEYETASMEVSTAAAVVDAAEASLAAANAGPTIEEIAIQQALVDQAQAEVEQKQRDLAKTTIVAPYDGVVTSINVEVGERVAPTGDPLLEIMDISYLVAEIGIPESFVGAVHLSDQATVTASGAAEPVVGLVVAINELVDPETRTFRVRVAIDNARARLKAGQFVSVRLPLGRSGDASLVVPSRSVVLVEGQPCVFVLEGDRLSRQRVKLGFSTDDGFELLSGVQEGDQVVVDDPSRVSDGMVVSIRPTESIEQTSIKQTESRIATSHSTAVAH